MRPATLHRSATGLVILAALALCVHSQAHADEMDLALYRLRVAASPDSEACSPSDPSRPGSRRSFCPDNRMFRRLMSQLGIAMAPVAHAPARSLGYAGFHFGLSMTTTGIDSEREYWARGTRGDERASIEGANVSVADALVWGRARVRKGLFFGLELDASLGHGLDTNLWSAGLGLKWSPFEGFYAGEHALPDVAVRGSLQRMFGSSEASLTIPAVELLVSQRLTVGGMAVVTPYLGLQALWLMAGSELIDFTPDVDAFTQCRPGAGHMLPTDTSDGGTRICADEGDADDFANNARFESFTGTRWRLALGAQGQYRQFTATAAMHFDLVPPSFDASVPPDMLRQLSLHLGLGLTY